MREEGFITAAQEAAAARSRPRIRPFPGATESRYGYAKEFLRQQFRDRFGGDHPPDWTVQTTFVPELQDAAERAVENGLRRFGNRDLQAALVVVDPRPATCSPWWAAGISASRSSTARGAAGVSRDRRSSRFLYAAALSEGYSPVSVLDGLDVDSAAGARRVGAAQRRRRGGRHADPAGRADGIEQPRRGAPAAADRIRGRSCVSPRTSACAICPTCRRCRSAPASCHPWS